MKKLFIYIFLLLFSVSIVNAGIDFDSVFYGGFANPGTSHSFSHTTSGDDRLLIVGTVGSSSGGSDLVTGVTYNGIAMTKINSSSNYNGRWISLWYLVNPALGSNTVTITASSSDLVGGASISYTGVNQLNPIDTTKADTYMGTSFTSTLASTLDNTWGFMYLRDTNGGKTYTSTTGDSVRLDANAGLTFIDTNSNITPAGSNTMSGTISASIATGDIFHLTLVPSGVVPPVVTPIISIDDVGLVNNSYHNSNFNIYLNFSVTDTSDVINVSYILDGVENTLFNNRNISFFTTNWQIISTSIGEGEHNISWIAENDDTQTNSSQYTFTIDTTNPITDATYLQIYSYFFSGTLFSCEDTNLDYCNITINNQTGDISTLFNLTENGNLTYNIYAQDLAGNTLNYSNILFVNPYQYFSFNDSLRDLIVQDSIFGSYTGSGDYVKIKTYDLGFGSYNYLFTKAGYIESYHNFTLNSTIQLNETYQVEPSNLFFTLKDFSTSNSISDWVITIKQNDTILSTQNVSSTFQLLYNDTYQNDLEFIFQKTGYNPSYYYIDFSSGSTATETIYLLNSSSDVLMPITIKDLLATNYIEGVSVNLYGIKENEEFFIDEQITDYAGKVYFTLNDNFLYKVIVSKNGYVTTNYKISPTEASYTFLIPESTTSLNYVFAGFSYSLDLYELNNITYARARYTDEDSLINKVTLNYLTDTNYSLTSSTDTLLIPLNDSLKSYILHLEVIRDSVTYDFYKTFANEDLLYNSSSSLSATEYVPDQEDKTLISIFILMASIIVGFFMFGQVGGYLGSVMALLSLWYLGLMSVYIAMPLLLFTLLMFGFFRGGDY